MKQTLSIRIDQTLIEEVRSAVVTLQRSDPTLTLTSWVEQALRGALGEAENTHNAGRPFTASPVPLRPGRRIIPPE